MSINLIRANFHNNNLALFKETAKDHTNYIKKSLSIEANEIIKEFQGYKWFYENIIREENLAKLRNSVFKEITVPEFKGKKYLNEKKFYKYKDQMIEIVNFYNESWPKEKSFVIHGDMGLSNFIFGDKIYLIDWEHFHKTELRYWGIDIFNMIFISFYLRLNNNYLFTNKDLDFIKIIYSKLINNCKFEAAIQSNPFLETKRYIVSNYKKLNSMLLVNKKICNHNIF